MTAPGVRPGPARPGPTPLRRESAPRGRDRLGFHGPDDGPQPRLRRRGAGKNPGHGGPFGRTQCGCGHWRPLAPPSDSAALALRVGSGRVRRGLGRPARRPPGWPAPAWAIGPRGLGPRGPVLGIASNTLYYSGPIESRSARTPWARTRTARSRRSRRGKRTWRSTAAASRPGSCAMRYGCAGGANRARDDSDLTVRRGVWSHFKYSGPM